MVQAEPTLSSSEPKDYFLSVRFYIGVLLASRGRRTARAEDWTSKETRKRVREERACRSGGFFRLSKYETILYGYLLPPERFFFLVS